MLNIRIGIRLKLLILSLFLFAIPWLGYKYVWELESYLRNGQEQTLIGTARAVATALHERPSLFDNQAAYLQDVKTGTDLYAHKIIDPIQLDGKLADWLDYRHLALRYDERQLISQSDEYDPDTLHFEHMVGQYRQYLYAMFEVTDQQPVYRSNNSLRVDLNDHLLIALTAPDGQYARFVVAPNEAGWVNAYRLDDDPESMRPQGLDTRIQGFWRATDKGYNIELRFPLDMLASSIAFAIVDVDNRAEARAATVIGTADPNASGALGTILVPSPEIERIIQGLKYSNARVWVVDKHLRVLARSGSIQSATGIRANVSQPSDYAWWRYIERHWLLPLYYQILTKPPADFIDELENAYALSSSEFSQAMQGEPNSHWRLSPDNKAVILSAAHPIFIDEQVMGAVVVEQTTHGIRTLRNRALEQLFHVILAVVVLGTLALFVFASRISFRISRLRNQTEAVIDSNGKILGNIPVSGTRDEIGDLSRTFHSVLDKLNEYTSYLENMGSRLSHELRTPVAVVNSSLENLMMAFDEERRHPDDESRTYLVRAQQGVKRLSQILSSMSEATRLEQAIIGGARVSFEMDEVIEGCVQGYRLAYPAYQFSLEGDPVRQSLSGSPELFAQMLDKIIANATEFSPSGSDITLTRQSINGRCQLTIFNPNAALPEGMQQSLLDSMVSVRAESHTDVPHLGLGLYIAKMIAVHHDGTIEINNHPEKSGVMVILTFSS